VVRLMGREIRYFWLRIRKRSGLSHSEMFTYLSECVRRQSHP
jgi:hypothetical protein